ncbi:hypothetical protein F5Y07DRAFT_302904 [Xylaria sp. FL0933]|nr:hypothetical protein F5Y07DRAFT_302904 [Xylaria sp. FL0933]
MPYLRFFLNSWLSTISYCEGGQCDGSGNVMTKTAYKPTEMHSIRHDSTCQSCHTQWGVGHGEKLLSFDLSRKQGSTGRCVTVHFSRLTLLREYIPPHICA